jgi:hypothetical protein
MLRLESKTGWWLVTHPEHGRLAGAIAARWGNRLFAPPEPSDRVLRGIHAHDDGWARRDAHPRITKQGKPSAFSVEVAVGGKPAFAETDVEIDLEEYLGVREHGVAEVAARDAYAALLVSLHTCDLLTKDPSREAIAPEQLPLLDAFLLRQRKLQKSLRAAVSADPQLTTDETGETAIQDGFRLLQAADRMSLLACVEYATPTTLLHPLRLRNGCQAEVTVTPLGERRFRLAPYPLDADEVRIPFPARFVPVTRFASAAEFETAFHAAAVQELEVVLVS